MLCAKYGFGPSEDFAAQTSDQSFCAIILGSRTQTSDPRICCANLGSARNILGSRNQTSAIHGNKPTIDRARKAARPSASTKPRSIVHVCVRDRSLVCCHGWPRFCCAILEYCVRIRGLLSITADPRCAQQNPWIRGLRARS